MFERCLFWRRRPVAGIVLSAFLLSLSSACSQRDQATPEQSNVWMVSEKREIEIGDKVAAEIEREFPVFENAELARYIDAVGQTLAKVSDRSNLRYTFKVLNTPIANAFATPGGHVYLTRGILGILDDEAELAGVIGHEIGHVAARHSAKRMQGATLATIGMVAAVLLAGRNTDPEVLRAADLATRMIFLGYSRSDEDQADLLSVKYLYRAGYDPEGMADALEALLKLERRSPMQAEQFFMSHPLTRDRIEHVRNWIPRVPREDPWRNRYPGTKLRGKKVYERKALPYAQYPGASDIAALVENYRIGIVRGQIKMVDKALADDFKDDHGRDKKAYLEYLSGLFERARWIDYRIEDLEIDTAKTGGTARYHYRFRVRDRDSGNVFDEKGVAYLEFSKPLEFLWKIRAIRMVKE